MATCVYFLDDPVIGRSLELYGEYCHDEIEWMKTLTNPKSFVLDIGANIGTHTIGIRTTRQACYGI
jgi:hypothetical protein